MIHYFLEYSPFIRHPKRVKFLALTPLACYQLDKAKMIYDIPETYAYPKRFDMQEIKNKLIDTRMNVFIEHCLQYEEASRYWDEFIENYFYDYFNTDIDIEVKYYGSSLKYLKNKLILLGLL